MTTSPSPSPARLLHPLFAPGQVVYWIAHPPYPLFVKGSTVRDIVSAPFGLWYVTADGWEHRETDLFTTFGDAQLAIPGYQS